MRISYNWLQEYLPEIIEPERLSRILTSIGLEVENLEKLEETPGSFRGLVAGEVISCEKHSGADKLKITMVDLGNGKPLQIVCGAENVAVGQKVVVAPAGTTIHPINSAPFMIKQAKIRGIDSYGMLCAEDEIGVSTDHGGIIVLPANIEKGELIVNYYQPVNDYTFVIGLTPNRIDAMSHLGVAKDVCAFLSHHDQKAVRVNSPVVNFKADNTHSTIEVIVENGRDCPRYTGVSISNLEVKQSPQWLQTKLKSIGVRPINNIVDITNFILHETGQPLHAFDLDKIKGKKIIVKNLPSGTTFTTLDENERKLNQEDLMICDGEEEPICMGGVYGGLNSGISGNTKNIFLESAWFDPVTIRKTSLRHNLRTEAAMRFEKGTDISNTANVLKRAAMMIREMASGKISSEIVDVYPAPKKKTIIQLQFNYLKKISGKEYNPGSVNGILQSLGFEVSMHSDHLTAAVPFSKADVILQADVIEEIMRIDGFDNIEIPEGIFISPSTDAAILQRAYMEKTSDYLAANGFSEIFTNSITNSAYYDDKQLEGGVKIMNSLSTALDVMRPGLLQTGLECIAYNLNRKNLNLLLFEFGKSYSQNGKFTENEHLCLYFTGSQNEPGWRIKENRSDLYFAKGICTRLLALCGIEAGFLPREQESEEHQISVVADGTQVGRIIEVGKSQLERFSIRQPVLFADIYWDQLMMISKKTKIEYREIPKFPVVHRDLSMVVDKNIVYASVESIIRELNIARLTEIKLFDVFESEKLGMNKKSFAISLSFSDTSKTLTDKETDQMMNEVIQILEKKLGAQIRTAALYG
ncbi:MAG: phenylalanine--tRNA ligase subunit beta [Ginsengibacter sp.]